MYRRNILNNILDALSDTPVVFLRGARQTGKSTLVRKIADGPYPARYVTLDNAAVFSAASADPTGFLAGIEKPVVIDEAQRVRNLFLAIKEDVDRNRTPGRYLLTGSADVLTIPKVADALAGRMELLTLWPLSISELKDVGENILDTFFDNGFPNRFHPGPDFDLAGSIVAGGFPEPVQRSAHRRRRAWFESYITTILDRDIRDLAQIQDLAVLPRLLQLLAGRTATLHNQSEVSRSSGIPNSTLSRYMTLLEMTFLVQTLPAWSSNLGKRLVKAPKLFMVDTGLACHLLGIDEEGFQQRGEIAGRVFENFVVVELLKYASWSDEPVRLYHFRSQSGQEVDVVIERSGGKVVGVEIKLSASPSPRDFYGLKVLREHLGDKFVRGILIYNGREIVPFEKDLYAVPVSILTDLFKEYHIYEDKITGNRRSSGRRYCGRQGP
ncbi:MAG: ATP-binding protein [Desulfomonilaceae bacterium]